MNRALVIGYGSIGSRHARLLSSMGVATAVLSARNVDFEPAFHTLETALKSFAPTYVVVANRTSEHRVTVEMLKELRFSGVVLVEKPLFMIPDPMDVSSFRAFYVAYNLRFHPVLRALKDALANERVISVQAYVGKYLPEWRPGTDYRKSYSARIKHGGGVLRDLSHELDYLCWIFGKWESVAALGGRYSELEIESADAYGLLAGFEKANVVTLQLNYLDRMTRREILVNTRENSFKADLIANVLESSAGRKEFRVERDDTYRDQHQEALSGTPSNLCTYEDGMRVLKMIEAAETSQAQRAWVAA